MNKDIQILRDLAKKVAEVASKDIQQERRELWRKHNSLIRTRPLIYVRAFAWSEIFPQNSLKCEDSFYKSYERSLHEMLYRDTLGDDYIIEPWVTAGPVYAYPEKGQRFRWGPKISTIPSTEQRGSFQFDPPIKNEEDLEKLVVPEHRIDRKATKEASDRIRDAIGDILEIDDNSRTLYYMWHADISTDLAYLRGLEQIMWDM